MNILNNTMEEFINISKSNIFPILKLIELKLDLSININPYNPRLIIFISRVLAYLIQNENNNNKINNISKFYPDINDIFKNNFSKFISDYNNKSHKNFLKKNSYELFSNHEKAYTIFTL